MVARPGVGNLAGRREIDSGVCSLPAAEFIILLGTLRNEPRAAHPLRFPIAQGKMLENVSRWIESGVPRRFYRINSIEGGSMPHDGSNFHVENEYTERVEDDFWLWTIEILLILITRRGV